MEISSFKELHHPKPPHQEVVEVMLLLLLKMMETMEVELLFMQECVVDSS